MLYIDEKAYPNEASTLKPRIDWAKNTNSS